MGSPLAPIAIVPVIVNTGMNHLLMRNAVTASTHELTDTMRHHWAFVLSYMPSC